MVLSRLRDVPQDIIIAQPDRTECVERDRAVDKEHAQEQVACAYNCCIEARRNLNSVLCDSFGVWLRRTLSAINRIWSSSHATFEFGNDLFCCNGIVCQYCEGIRPRVSTQADKNMLSVDVIVVQLPRRLIRELHCQNGAMVEIGV